MSDTNENPIDPFASIDLGKFKAGEGGKKKTPQAQPDKAAIKEAAEQSNFQSRQAVVKKQKIITKTFSLFQEEGQIINAILRACLDDPDASMSQPSGSDIVRAALHLLAEKDQEDQVRLVKEHRGRGRK